jgi:hypothetical protein
MARTKTAFLLVLLASTALTAACGPDRFTDSGCTSDTDCRGDRVCVEGLCVGEERAPDVGEDVDEDGEMMDTGVEEDADDAGDLDAFVGQWGLEGPITVLTEDGETLQQTDAQPFPTGIERGEDSDLFIDIEPLQGCTLLADVTGPAEFELRARDCESSPVDQIQGEATVLEGTGLLRQEDTSLQMQVRIQIESMDFGQIILEFEMRGPRLNP